ncbi:MAG: helix-turn-helix transcriptional regulator [Eubacteriales bacterium]|nr:helix-turn-helix transcriptional regulator [Eubacteriales bacterium]
MTVNERIKYLRKHVLHLTQEELAPQIKISRSNLGAIEIGRVKATDRVIEDLCEKHDVNIDWLLKGEGDPLREKTRTEKITDFAADILKDEEESFRRRLIEALADLDIEEWELLEKIAEKASKNKKARQ